MIAPLCLRPLCACRSYDVMAKPDASAQYLRSTSFVTKSAEVENERANASSLL